MMPSLHILLLSIPIATAASTGLEQCHGLKPMPSVANFLGATLDYEVADNICCHNHRFAEYRGYLAAPEVDLFGRLHPDVETTFFDSVCGLPLFIAPRGRTFEEFKDESLHHGWPSFRPEEIVSENVIIHSDGRMESKCLTHLGHNLPEGGVDRYCIDLVCMAGMPLEGGSPVNIAQTLSLNDENIITAEGLDPDTYESSAEQWSGKNNYARKRIIIGVGVAIAFVSAVGMFHCAKRACRRMSSQTEKNVGTFDEEQSSGSTETY